MHMFLMSTSMLLRPQLIFLDCKASSVFNFPSCNSFDKVAWLGRKRRGFSRHVLNAKKKKEGYSRKRSWWQKFFFDDDGNWLGLKGDGMLEDELESVANDEDLSDDEKFEAWKKRAEAIIELKEAQEDVRNEQGQRWTDWLYDDTNHVRTSWSQDWDNGLGELNEESSDASELVPEKGLVESVRDLVLGKEEDDMLYEDRVFQYASLNSAKFLTVLIIIPWALDFVVHDYVLMPFLDRYVKKVPLAAEFLDVRRHQKLEMVEDLKIEKARFKLEMEIGKSPPLSDEELWGELRHKALTMRDEWRLENRKAFANIWSDMVFGISLFILLYFNQSKDQESGEMIGRAKMLEGLYYFEESPTSHKKAQGLSSVALLKFTGYKIISNISDTGKAFLIILITDIFLGYHSESGWQTLLEIIVEHYGLEVDQSVITIFICLVPVIMDACVKLWLFKFLPRLSPRVANLFQEMKRH